MKKKPDPDLQSPDEAAIEEHVRQMMDVSVPENSKPKSIRVFHDDEESSEKDEAADAAPIKITFSDKADDVEEEVVTAPPLEDSEPEEPKKSVKKSIVIKHFSENSDDGGEPEPKSEEEPEEDSTDEQVETEKPAKSKPFRIIPLSDDDVPATVENPLIPTDKLVSAIEPNDAEPTAPPIEEEAAEEKPAETTKKAKSAKKSKATKAKIDKKPEAAETVVTVDKSEKDVPSEPEPEEEDAATAIAAAFPGISEEAETEPEETSEEVEEKTSKFDRFTPLTTIRPRMPDSDGEQGPLKLDDDDVLDEAVDDIMVSEADQLLSTPVVLPVETTEPEPLPVEKAQPKPKAKHRRLKLRPKQLLITLVLVALCAIAVLAAIPVTRNRTLNTIGMRASITANVVDQTTGLPLQDAIVKVDGKTAETDIRGQAMLNGIRYGKANVEIVRQAYKTNRYDTTIKLSTKSLPTVTMIPEGNVYTISVSDWLSSKPVRASASSVYGNALASSDGIIKFAADKKATKPFEVTVSAAGYRSEIVKLDPAQLSQTQPVKLVVTRKHAYVVKRGSNFDVYAEDLDGQHAQLVLAGMGAEQQKTLVLVPSPYSSQAAYITVSDYQGGDEKGAAPTLVLINLEDGSHVIVNEAAQLQVVGWQGDNLVFARIGSSSKAADANRQQLISYNVKTQKSQTLASANYFNYVLMAEGKIYFAPSSAYQPASNIGFFQINPDGSGKTTILTQEVWNVYRTTYDRLSLSVQQDWYEYKLGGKTASKLSAAPPSLVNPLYVESPDGQHSLWLNEQTDPAKLSVYDKSSGKSTDFSSHADVAPPFSWLSSSAFVFRVVSGKETADYTYDLTGGKALKLHDVLNVNSITNWQVH